VHTRHTSGCSNIEEKLAREQNVEVAHPPKTRRQVQEHELRSQIQDQDTEINKLTAELNAANLLAERLSAELTVKIVEISELQVVAHRNRIEHENTSQGLEETRLTLDEIHNKLKKIRKHEQRVTREKNHARKNYLSRIQHLNTEKEKIFTDLSSFIAEAQEKADRLRQSANGLQNDLTEARNTTAFLRKKVHSLDMQRRRAQNAVSATRRRLLEVSNWRPTKRGAYTPEARKLAHALLRAGCVGDRVSYAIAACAKAFHIRVTTLMSRRTVFRARDEGGHFGLIQIGREITQSKGQIPFIPHYCGIIDVSMCQVLVKVVMGPQIVKSPTNHITSPLPVPRTSWALMILTNRRGRMRQDLSLLNQHWTTKRTLSSKGRRTLLQRLHRHTRIVHWRFAIT